jgi:hypothetical protein
MAKSLLESQMISCSFHATQNINIEVNIKIIMPMLMLKTDFQDARIFKIMHHFSPSNICITWRQKEAQNKNFQYLV